MACWYVRERKIAAQAKERTGKKKRRKEKKVADIKKKCKNPAAFNFMIHDKADLAQKMIDVRYDLGPMNKVCHYCKGKGFECEVKGQWSDPDDLDNTLFDFGSLCCCKGKVVGIAHYDLPDALDSLYTDSKDEKALHFCENARIYNNGMAMSSLACEQKWRSRTDNYKHARYWISIAPR